MGSQNRYCCRCRRTTRFAIDAGSAGAATFTCGGCGVEVKVPRERLGETLLSGPGALSRGR